MALFLPMTLSLGMGTHPAGVKIWPAIEAFLQQKGLVASTCMPERDEFLQPLKVPAALEQQVVPFKTINKDLRGALEQHGVKPWVMVQGAGLTAGEILPYVHELRSAKGTRGYLVGLLLPPASAKRTVALMASCTRRAVTGRLFLYNGLRRPAPHGLLPPSQR